MRKEQQIYLFAQIQTSQTEGGRPYGDTFPYKLSTHYMGKV